MVMQVVPLDQFPLIDRSQMPQVDNKQYTDLFMFLGERGIQFSGRLLPAELLHMHQEVDPDKARAIPAEILKIPVLISIDLLVIDGNHRVYRHYLDKTHVPCLKIEASFGRAVKNILEFPGTFELP
jgi:hypothetical protein